MTNLCLFIGGVVLMSTCVCSSEVTSCLRRTASSNVSSCHRYAMNCSAKEYIHLQRIYYGLVTRQACPPPQTCHLPDGCCEEFANYECNMAYPLAAQYDVYASCSARHGCKGLPVAAAQDVQPECPAGTQGPGGPRAGHLLPVTSVIQYECLDESQFINFCSNTKKTIRADNGRSIHIMHRHNTNVPDNTSPITCTCSVAAEVDNDVIVRYEDIRLHKPSDTTRCSSAVFVDRIKMGCADGNPADGFKTSVGPEYNTGAATVALEGVYSRGEEDTPTMVWVSFRVTSVVSLTVDCGITPADSDDDTDDDRDEEDNAVHLAAIIAPVASVLVIVTIVLLLVLWRRGKKKNAIPVVDYNLRDSFAGEEVYSTINPEDVSVSRHNSYYTIEGNCHGKQNFQRADNDGYDKITSTAKHGMSTTKENDGYNRLNFKVSNKTIDQSEIPENVLCYNKLVDTRNGNQESGILDDYDKATVNSPGKKPIMDGNEYNHMPTPEYNKVDFVQLDRKPDDPNYSHINDTHGTSGSSASSYSLLTPAETDNETLGERSHPLNDEATEVSNVRIVSAVLNGKGHLKRADSYEDPDIPGVSNMKDDYQTAKLHSNESLDNGDDYTSNGENILSDIVLPTRHKRSDGSDTSDSDSVDDSDINTMHTNDGTNRTDDYEEAQIAGINTITDPSAVQSSDYELPHLDNRVSQLSSNETPTPTPTKHDGSKETTCNIGIGHIIECNDVLLPTKHIVCEDNENITSENDNDSFEDIPTVNHIRSSQDTDYQSNDNGNIHSTQDTYYQSNDNGYETPSVRL